MKTNVKTIFSILVLSLFVVDFGVQVPSAYSQPRFLTEGIEYLIRFASKNPTKIKKAYRIVAEGVAVVNTMNGAYRIYVDCRRGLASKEITYLPQDQQVSLVRDMCRNYF
ncbi:hypothetical protein [Microcystis sp.]|jgi:hypothetical protein|uniref:hypothetical protein n=1 Tax=Microcystis sp. TaxID=1127 RepID=UPI003AF4287F